MSTYTRSVWVKFCHLHLSPTICIQLSNICNCVLPRNAPSLISINKRINEKHPRQRQDKQQQNNMDACFYERFYRRTAVSTSVQCTLENYIHPCMGSFDTADTKSGVYRTAFTSEESQLVCACRYINRAPNLCSKYHWALEHPHRAARTALEGTVGSVITVRWLNGFGYPLSSLTFYTFQKQTIWHPDPL